MVDWNSEQYLMFENERTQPAIDLVNRINLDNPKKIIDIGCGPVNITQVLARKFPNAYILGVDSSSNMIETAKGDYPNIEFKVCDASKDLAILDNDFEKDVFERIVDQYTTQKNGNVIFKFPRFFFIATP